MIIKDILDGQETYLTTGQESAVSVPKGSWVGAKITFASDLNGYDQIYTINQDGTGRALVGTQQTDVTGHYQEPVFNPKNTNQIAFEFFQGEDETVPHKIGVFNNGVISWLTSGATDDRLPAWSDDGAKILFQRAGVAAGKSSGIYTVQVGDITGSTLTNIHQISGSDDVATDNSWAYDDTQFVSSVAVGDAIVPAIWVYSAAGQGRTAQVTNSTMQDEAPAQSHDNRFIVFESHLPDVMIGNVETSYPANIYFMQAPQLQSSQSAIWLPTPQTTFQWQLNGVIDLNANAQVFDLDLFENDKTIVDALHAKGKKVIAYINAGAYQPGQPDSAQFTSDVIGRVYGPDWPDEKWIDIRSPKVRAIMAARLDLAKQKGFDGIEPDNINSYEMDMPGNAGTGFSLTAADQIDYNRWFADASHARGLSVGLKNDGDQVSQLLPYFDWALIEECALQGFCPQFKPFTDANKAVFMTEYSDTTVDWLNACATARQLRFTAVYKTRDLNAQLTLCP